VLAKSSASLARINRTLVAVAAILRGVQTGIGGLVTSIRSAWIAVDTVGSQSAAAQPGCEVTRIYRAGIVIAAILLHVLALLRFQIARVHRAPVVIVARMR
jgi:hypothetical protein